MSIQSELAAFREAAKIPGEALAASAGVSKLELQRIELGTANPELSKIEGIARALGLELLLVPASLRQETINFIQSGGKIIGQPAGVGAPLGLVEELLRDMPGADKPFLQP